MTLIATLLLGATIFVRDSTTGLAARADVSREVAIASPSGEVTIWVDSVEPDADLRPDRVATALRAGSVLFPGHVSDRENALPRAGAVVASSRGRISARTNERGYFWMQVTAADDEYALPIGDELTIEIDGYKEHVIKNT